MLKKKILFLVIVLFIFLFLILGYYIIDKEFRQRVNLASRVYPQKILKTINKIYFDLVIEPEKLLIEYNLKTKENDLAFENDSFIFVHLGHTKGQGKYDNFNPQHLAKTAELIKKLNPDFILHSGDLLLDPSNLGEWKNYFFRPFKEIKVPIYISPANHESYDNYQNYQKLIRKDLWYSFNVNNYHFIVVAYIETSAEQIEWFKNEIKNNQNIIILLGGQENNVFQNIIQSQPAGTENIKLVLAGDGQPLADEKINNIPYLIIDEFNIRKIDIKNDIINISTLNISEF